MSKLAFRIWQDYPLLGVGYGRDNFRQIAPEYGYTGASLVVHNTYTEVLVDSGIFAFLFHVALLFGSILWLGRSVRRMSEVAPGLALYPAALQMGLIAFAVISTFGSREDFDLYYMLLMAAAAWYQIVQTLELEKDVPQELSEETPVAAAI
jgi:O-antigen ligase